MQKLAAVLLTILATNAFAFQGRPVSDLRFEGQAWITDYQIASDGVDFLVLSTTQSLRHLFTQKIIGGRPVGPHRQIGSGTPAGLIWTGTEYLAASVEDGNLWVTRVSRDGSPISTPAAVMAGGSLMVGNHNGALVFRHDAAKIAVQRLDTTGKPVGGIMTYDAPPVDGWRAAGAAAGGFGVTFSGTKGTWLMTFRADGSAITTAPVLLDGPYDGSSTDRVSATRAVATNGTDTMVVFSVRKYGEDAELKSAVVGADGTVKGVSLAYPGAVSPFGLIWDGSQYITTILVEMGPDNFKPALIRIGSNGERIGELVWISAEEKTFAAAAPATNGRDLIVPFSNYTTYPAVDSFYVPLDAATLTPRTRVAIGRTLTTQSDLTLAAVSNGYLAAWFENAEGMSTLRLSRIDAAGNYLDGAGIVVDTMPSQDRFERRTISIDTHGPRWFVVWAADHHIWGKFLSARGTPEGATVPIGYGHEAAVRWDGTRYIVLRSDSLSMYRDLISASGVISETKTIAEYEDLYGGGMTSEEILYTKPSLIMAGNRPLAVYGRDHYVCGMFPGECEVETTVTGLFLDTTDPVPFTIGTTDVDYGISVAASPGHVLVAWPDYELHGELHGTLLDANAPEQGGASFSIDQTAMFTIPSPSLAFDGHDFIAAWWRTGLRTARISTAGTTHDRRLLSLRSGEGGLEAVVAASATHRPLAGFSVRVSSYDSVLRGALVFENEIGDIHSAPSAPEITCATRIEDAIRVQWQPAANVLGVAVELQLPDETFRTIGVASSGATTATVPLPDLEGSAVRLRAWNGFGVSQPSGIAPSLPAPAADVHAMTNACAGVPVEVTATLTGAPPFVVRWSDGVTQTVSDGYTATRLLTLDRDTRIAVESVTDASCEAGTMNGGVDIQVTAAPLIAQQSRIVRVSRNQAATLSVVTPTHGTRFAWYEGVRGDTAHPVGSNDATFNTPPATRTMQYWVRLTTACGTIDSETMTVSVDTRRRAARK